MSDAEQLLAQITEHEISSRKARGLPPYHLLDMGEFPFAFSQDLVRQFDAGIRKAIAKAPPTAPLMWAETVAALALKDYARANVAIAAFERLAPQQAYGVMRFGVASSETRPALPPVVGEYPSG